MPREITLREHMTNIRKNVRPENCARSAESVKRALDARWPNGWQKRKKRK